MSFDQENSGEGHDTLPQKEKRPLNGLAGASLGNLATQRFDSLGAGAGGYCGQYQYSCEMPFVAAVARMLTTTGEAQL